MGAAGSDLARRRDRIRTLLPIARNVLMIVIAVVAILMALSSLGVEIGPLIAGAGIVGVAIGFGAQTVVKDIISGVFYLLDDAFRVGEYIQSGSYKGTVESFSLRSVKLRHHRGSIFTVPFSDLGAIQNMSRDWVIDKITLTITYDSDVDMARKIVKKIGLELAQDPEFAAATLQPLKMQGIDEFGEVGPDAADEDHDQAGRAVHHQAPRADDDQEGLRRERHQAGRSDGAGLRRLRSQDGRRQSAAPEEAAGRRSASLTRCGTGLAWRRSSGNDAVDERRPKR